MAYRALVGMNYPPDRRAEAGDVVDDLPAKSVKWLLSGGYIESADAPVAPDPIPEPDPAPEPEPAPEPAPEGVEA